ncbi:MAG: hypothetical protein IPL26_00075 [Leptospiraceae bacterium]|nr:hypothetical protein [Leptospiraceae bacterium]
MKSKKKKPVEKKNPYQEFLTDGKFDSNKFIKRSIITFIQVQILKLPCKKSD